MARIPEAEIERLKQDISVQRLAEGLGVDLKRHGADLIGLCPFHDDHEPSLVISPKTNLWHCLGACQTGGSVIDWVMKAEGVSFRHAVELLQADYQPLAAAKAVKRSTTQKLPAALNSEADDQQLLHQVIDYYHEALKQSPDALAYLEKRGLANAGAIERFKLGFANRTLGYRLPEKNRKEGAAIRSRLQRLGLMRASGHEHFNGSLVIPVISEGGVITEVYGRKLGERLRKGTPLHLYLPGPHKGVWNSEALSASNEIILCESLIDALTFWCAGYRNVTASYGVEGFTADHLAAFKEQGIERVLIAYDRDDAGEAAAAKLSKRLNAEGLDCYRLHFPKGMDANEYACQVKPASKSLGVVIRSAHWLGQGEPKPLTTATTVSEPPVPQTVEPKASAKDKNEAESLHPLAATPLPVGATDIEAEVTEHEVTMTFGDRRYRIRGLNKNHSHEQLKVNVLTSHAEAFHVDTLDLYSAKQRALYIKQVAVELGLKEDVIKHDLGKVLLKLEALQDQQIKQANTPEPMGITLSDEERQAALDLLKDPQLLARILADFERCGVVGEATNKLVGYLACVSRKLDKPLAVIIQSTSAAGKSALMDAVLALMPEEERVHYAAMTGQSLFYMGETDLKHKILAIAEEEGASEASYALKLLQSQGELTIASTGKDATTGKLVTHEYRVEGPVMIMLTTTAIEIDEELLNRCVVLTVDEGREQTQAIHALQRQLRTLEGLLAKAEKNTILTQHRNAQRLLRPLAVVNPYAQHLTFTSDQTRTRRDHEKYLTLIDAIALLHQYQRPVKAVEHQGQAVEYIEVTLDDIETANHLAHDVLGRTLDELPPQTRKLLRLIVAMVKERCEALDLQQSDYRFSRRDVREHTQWGNTQLKIHLKRLEELEYLLVHRGGRGQSFVYELLYDGSTERDRSHLNGLIDADELRQKQHYDAKKSGHKPKRPGSSRGQVGAVSGSGQSDKTAANANSDNDLTTAENDNTEKGTSKNKNNGASYRTHEPVLVAKGAE